MSSTARKVGFAGREGHPMLTGLLIGLVAGVGLSAGVAVWIAHMPSPFQNRTTDSGSGPAGSVLGGGPASGPPNAPASGGSAGAPAASASLSAVPTDGTAAAGVGSADSALSGRLATRIDPVRIDGTPANAGGSQAELSSSGAARDANGQPAPATSSSTRVPDGTPVFLQVGAYSGAEDAQKQVEAVAQLTGAHARITTSEGDRPLYRVRVGPFTRGADYAELVDALKANGIGSTLVRTSGADASH